MEVASIKGLLQARDRDCQEQIVGVGELEALDEGKGKCKSVRKL